MIKKILFFLLSILLTSFLVGAQTTIVNLMWLSSVEMPVTLMVLISSLFQDFYMLSLSPALGMPSYTSSANINSFRFPYRLHCSLAST